MSNMENAELQELLSINTKRGKWEVVVAIYEEASEVAHNLKLTQRGDTALHLAVVDNKEKIVKKLVKSLTILRRCNQLLEISNDKGNTPLHLAAELGSARMCHYIASVHEGLVNMRNNDGQTPLFLAAMYGHKNVFYYLYYVCKSDVTQACRQNNGDSVLHCALENEQFELAFQLLHMNKDAKNWVNEKGLTPLHVLASKPTSFKSGAHIKRWRNIVYYCTSVDQLKPESIQTLSTAWKKTKSKTNTATSYFSDNYKTCIDFFTWLCHGFLIVCSWESLFKKKNNEAKEHKDLENDVNMESENVDTVEPDERVDTGLLKAHRSGRHQSTYTNFPTNYTTCIEFFKIVFSAIMIILGFGFRKIKKIREKKQKHTWSIQVLEILLELGSTVKYEDDGYTPMELSTSKTYDQSETSPYKIVEGEVQFSGEYYPTTSTPKNSESPKIVKVTESAMLLAAKHGVIEMVRRLFEKFPSAIRDCSSDKKNIVLLAAASRQPDVYMFLLEKKNQIKSLFQAVDHNGDSALHLAATATDPKLWRITGAAFHMQWEVKWYKFVKESNTSFHVSNVRRNKTGKTASEIFHETHMSLVKEGGEWLYNTSESCSVVATLIATVAFASTVAIPGGTDESGAAILEKEEGFFIFAISSLIALCLSSTSVIMFLAILTSRFEAKEFGSNLPWKLLIGMSSLYFSIIASLISFCAGHYFLIIDRLQNIAILLYTVTFLPVALIFGIAQLPLYFDVLQSILNKVPKRSADVILSNDDASA